MKIGIQTHALFDGRTAHEAFQMIRKAGFDAVDLCFCCKLSSREIRTRHETHSETFFDAPLSTLKAYYALYREAAEQTGIEISQAHAPFPTYVGDAETDAFLLEVTEKVIDLCGFLGCPRLVIHPAISRYDSQLTPEEEWPMNVRRYGALTSALARNDVTACLENVFKRDEQHRIVGALCADPAEAACCVDQLNEKAGATHFAFCLDIGHTNLTGHELGNAIRTLGSRIVALHIHDNNGTRDEHIGPYLGTIDWDVFCKELKEIGYQGVLSFETGGMYERFPPELHGSVLRLLADTGHLFAKRMEAPESAICTESEKNSAKNIH